MRLNLVYFASVREIMQASTEKLTVTSDIKTVADLKKLLSNKKLNFSSINKILVAVNQVTANDNTLLKSDDEVALFPPVTGG